MLDPVNKVWVKILVHKDFAAFWILTLGLSPRNGITESRVKNIRYHLGCIMPNGLRMDLELAVAALGQCGEKSTSIRVR